MDSIVASADNAFEVYVNGSLVASSSNWKVAASYVGDLAAGDVIAVHATDAGGMAGFLAQVEWDDATVVSDGSWLVSTVSQPGWELPGFDDSGWAGASTYGSYGVAPWYMNVAGFPAGSTAQWIWSDDANGDNQVWLRITL